jgi:predicted TIM-barrel fold metal-dependent hydrolase
VRGPPTPASPSARQTKIHYVIIDFHTHVFPPDVIARHQHLVDAEPTFAELYANPEAKLATAEELLASMEDAGVDASVALGFAWSDPAICVQHNDYLIEEAARAVGRIHAFPNLPLAAGLDAVADEARRCAALGARGFGELRPDNLGFDLDGPDGDALAGLAGELDALLLFHVSEPVGHRYPGKRGLDIGAFYEFVCRHPDVRVVGAHLAGGLPFYAHMPEVQKTFANLTADTAAASLLYGSDVHQTIMALIGPEALVFGSDYPLLSQSRSLRRLQEAGLEPPALERVLGANAARLLRLR